MSEHESWSMRIRAIPFLLAVLTAGCSARTGEVGAVRHDPERAKLALVAALDAWKKGEARALSQRTPPIRFVDVDLAAGWRLAEYEIQEPDATIRPHTDVAVILSLRDRRGTTVRRETHYQVSTDPALAVLRSDP
jgi:hypothetical protein